MAKIDIARTQISTIKNATQVGENSATRVGNAMDAVVDVFDDYAAKAEFDELAQTTYSQCTSSASAASKTVPKTGYKLAEGNLVFVRFTNPTANYSGTTLNINSTGAKPLFYRGELATIYNTWDADELCAVYYDGTNYQAYGIDKKDDIFDVTLYNGGTTYASLADAIAAVPVSKKRAGMVIKYVDSNLQYNIAFYRLNVTTAAIFKNALNWHLVTSSPRALSADIPTMEYLTTRVVSLTSSAHQDIVRTAVNGYIFQSGTGNLSISGSSKLIMFVAPQDGKFYLSQNISAYQITFFDANFAYITDQNITPVQVASGIFEYSHNNTDAVYIAINGNSALTSLILYSNEYVSNYLAIAEKTLEIDALTTQLSGLQSVLADMQKTLQESNYTMCVMADIMPHVWSWLTASAYGIYNVTSATATSITLSSSDAAKFTSAMAVAVLFSDGHTDILGFKAASGTTLALIDNDADLSTATKVAPIWQTANEMHLTGFGYKGLAYIVKELMYNYSMIEKNMVDGSLNMGLSTQRTSWQDAKVYDADGNVVNTPIVSGLAFGGYAQTGLSNTVGIVSNTNFMQSVKGWLSKAYNICNGNAGYVEFSLGNSAVTGFLSIVAGRGSYTYTNGGTTYTVDGNVNVIVSDDKGQITTFDLPKRVKRINIPVSNAANIKVRFVLGGTVSHAQVYSITAYTLYTDAPSLSGARIAVLGDSWTQYPPSNNATVIPSDAFNVNVTRPDGTNGDGYGYFPKELARLTGATVDNWGKSGSTTEDWGLVKIDEILSHAAYDYIIIEFFTNDRVQGFTPERIVANLRTLAMKAKKKGVTPIIIMPCCTAAIGQSTSHGELRNYMIGGIL